MDNITGKLGDIGKMALLSGGPWWRGTEKGEGERLMINEKSELTSFEEKTEMVDWGVGSKKLSVEG